MRTVIARLRSIRARWINHRWLVSTGQRPQWTCYITGCEREISVPRRVLIGHCGQHCCTAHRPVGRGVGWCINAEFDGCEPCCDQCPDDQRTKTTTPTPRSTP